MKTKLLGLVASLTLFGAISPASANLIVNGSFEDGVDPGGSFKTIFGVDTTSITGWTVGDNSIDYISGYWKAGQGARSLDLSGNDLGSVSQSFKTTIGKLYTVSFLLAGNPDGGPFPKTVDVSVGTAFNKTFDFPFPGGTLGTLANMNWTPISFTFTANSNSELLKFASVTCATGPNACAFGPALDAVSVSAVPELSTWIMMLLGFAGIGMTAYRRARKTAPIAIV